MKSWKGNMMTLIGQVDALCVTTNGFRKNNGECVMGRGIARQLANRYPRLPLILGEHIRDNGNIPGVLIDHEGTDIVSFPVKPDTFVVDDSKSNVVQHMMHQFKSRSTAPGWASVASIAIIRSSAQQLVEMANEYHWERIAIPRAGCGAGELSWFVVKPVLDNILDDRFIECTYK